jgi:hypothetical protein
MSGCARISLFGIPHEHARRGSSLPDARRGACGSSSAVIVVVTTARVPPTRRRTSRYVLGTDNTMQWWFLITVPLAFTLMATRVIENLLEDLSNLRAGGADPARRHRGIEAAMTDGTIVTLISLGVTGCSCWACRSFWSSPTG